MKEKPAIVLFGLALMLLLLLPACSPVRPSDEAFLGTPVTESVFKAGTPQTDTQSGQGVMDLAAVQPSGVDNCLECHTDKEMLINTAAPEEVAEIESEGEG